MKYAITQDVLNLLHSLTSEEFTATGKNCKSVSGDIIELVTTDNLQQWSFEIRAQENNSFIIIECFDNPADCWWHTFYSLAELEERLKSIAN